MATVGDRDTGIPLVDGAYFEGSGIETLTAVRNALRPYEVKPDGPSEFPYITVHVIVIGSVQPAVDVLETIDEITPPLRTMLNARERRGYIAQDTLREWSHMIACPAVRPETQLAASLGVGAGEQKIMHVQAAAARPIELRLFQVAAQLADLRRHALHYRAT